MNQKVNKKNNNKNSSNSLVFGRWLQTKICDMFATARNKLILRCGSSCSTEEEHMHHYPVVMGSAPAGRWFFITALIEQVIFIYLLSCFLLFSCISYLFYKKNAPLKRQQMTSLDPLRLPIPKACKGSTKRLSITNRLY